MPQTNEQIPIEWTFKVIGWLVGAIMSLLGVFLVVGKMLHADGKKRVEKLTDELSEVKDELNSLKVEIQRLKTIEEFRNKNN